MRLRRLWTILGVVLVTSVVAIAMWGCGPTSIPSEKTLAQVNVILVDAAAGVSVGCGTGWLPPPDCTLAQNILDDAQQGANAIATGGWAAAAKAVLMVEERRLPDDSKIRPYLDAIISLL